MIDGIADLIIIMHKISFKYVMLIIIMYWYYIDCMTYQGHSQIQ